MSAAAYAQSAFQQGLDAYLKGEYRQALEIWKPAAESGDKVSAFNVGVLYAQGLGVDADPVEAVRWYRRSAIAGYANAQFNLGAAYYSGEGTEVNLAQAASWWEQAADQDHPEALYNLATLYRRGKGVERDVDKAIYLFQRAASLGDARAQDALAELKAGRPASGEQAGGQAEQGQGEGEDQGEGQRPSGNKPESKAATLAPGDSVLDEDPRRWTVQVFAGVEKEAALKFARDHGLSGRLRIYEAMVDGQHWYKGVYGSYPDRAAAQDAQAELARKLPSSPWPRSFKAIQAEAVAQVAIPTAPPAQAGTGAGSGDGSGKPAEQGSDAGSESPGSGDGAGGGSLTAKRDSGGEATEAARPEKTADDVQAALRKGQRAFNAQHYADAFEAWRPLAEQGVPEAQYGIGFMYESGWGVDRDYGEAFRWYQLAAQQGHVKAEFNLGMLYRNGQGVARNDALGLYWIQSAADRGDERAVDYLKDLN